MLSAQEIDNSQLNSSLTAEEKENDLTMTKTSLTDKQNQLSEYQTLLICVKNDTAYSGQNQIVNASYAEYNTNYNKAVLISEQYKTSYESLSDQYSEQNSQEKITSVQVETAKQNSESAYTNMVSYQSAYLSDIRSQILLIENQLISDNGNEELQLALNNYKELKISIEQGYDFNTNNNNLQNSYDQYMTGYTSLADDYNTKYSEYQDLYNKYVQQSSSGNVSETSVSNAKSAYESSLMDVDVLKIHSFHSFNQRSALLKMR